MAGPVCGIGLVYLPGIGHSKMHVPTFGHLESRAVKSGRSTANLVGVHQAYQPPLLLSVYKHQGWDSWGDWLGTGYVSVSKQNSWLYEDAKTFVRELGIKTRREWMQHAKSGKLPTYIPKSPDVAYKGKGWAGYGDWLGTGTIAHRKREWAPFKEARTFVRSLNLKVAWRAYCKSGERPINIPTDPAKIYKDHGWAGFPDWLGK